MDLDTGEEGGDGYTHTYINTLSLGYQTGVGVELMTNPIHNVANLGVAHPSPRGIGMTNHSPSSADVPLPSPLASHNPPPHSRMTATFWEKLGLISSTSTLHRTEGNPWQNFRHPLQGSILLLARFVPQLVGRPCARSR